VEKGGMAGGKGKENLCEGEEGRGLLLAIHRGVGGDYEKKKREG